MNKAKDIVIKGITILLYCTCQSIYAQSTFQSRLSDTSNAFGNLDVAVTAGTTGIGFDIATPITEVLRLRGGFAFMPRWHYNMNFGIQVGNDPSTSKSKFTKMKALLEQMTGYNVDDNVDMIGRPTFHNFNVMLDIFPFSKKAWHLTAGVYIGSSEIAEAYNPTHEMTSLLAVGMYNNIYEKCENYDPMISWPEGYDYPDVYLPDGIADKIYNYGRMGIHVGDYKKDVYDEEGNLIHKAGSPYMMEPDKESMIRAKMKANKVKSYIGFGYEGRLIDGNDRVKISFDAGAMLWGGVPDIYTHDGTNMTKDLTNISGKVGDYVDIAKQFKVYPVLNVRVAYSLH